MSHSVSRPKSNQTNSESGKKDKNLRGQEDADNNKISVDISPLEIPPDANFQDKFKYFLETIEGEISPQKFQTWIAPIIPVNFIEEKLILRLPSQFFYEWLISEYQDLIYQTTKKVFGPSTHIEYLIATGSDKPEEISLEKSFPAEDKDPHSQNEYPSYHIDERFQFDNYYTKNDNELALRAAQTVARHSGNTDYNPLFIYGGSGCGKTHLLYAIGNYIQSHRKKKKVSFLTSENFINQYILALQARKLDHFFKTFSQTDIVLLDDIQLLSNKKKSQEGLFYFLSELERQQKQIVITSNQPPVHLTLLDKRLLTFFQRGLIIDLIPPGYETRRKFIQAYCQKTNYTILPEVREFLATTLADGMQQLKAVLIRIVAQGSLTDKPITLEEIKKLLKLIDINFRGSKGSWEPRSPINHDKIIKYVSDYLNVPVDLILGYSRQREVVFARQIAIYLAKELSAATFQSLGYLFSNRHYTAITYNYKRIKKEMKNNPAIYNLIREIQNQLTDDSR